VLTMRVRIGRTQRQTREEDPLHEGLGPRKRRCPLDGREYVDRLKPDRQHQWLKDS
jgi:hypothetical protein